MIVSELIQELQKFPPDQLVVVDGYEGGYNDPHYSELTLKECADWFDGDWWGRYDSPEENGFKTLTGPEIKAVIIGRYPPEEIS